MHRKITLQLFSSDYAKFQSGIAQRADQMSANESIEGSFWGSKLIHSECHHLTSEVKIVLTG